MVSRPRILDCFCGQGGASWGYYLAGFDVCGIDINPMPRYPSVHKSEYSTHFEFHQADALEYLAQHGREFDAIHASPPCQRYSEQTAKKYRGNHPDLIDATREALELIGKPYTIENVEGARMLLKNPFMLCGTMFGLGVWRHRYFETSQPINKLLPPCNHDGYPVLITGTTRRSEKNGGRFEYSAQACREAAGLDWMTRKGMDEAIPPAYTEWIGARLLEYLAATP